MKPLNPSELLTLRALQLLDPDSDGVVKLVKGGVLVLRCFGELVASVLTGLLTGHVRAGSVR